MTVHVSMFPYCILILFLWSLLFFILNETSSLFYYLFLFSHFSPIHPVTHFSLRIPLLPPPPSPPPFSINFFSSHFLLPLLLHFSLISRSTRLTRLLRCAHWLCCLPGHFRAEWSQRHTLHLPLIIGSLVYPHNSLIPRFAVWARSSSLDHGGNGKKNGKTIAT